MVLYVDTCFLQLIELGLQENLLTGTLPNSWAGLTEASHFSQKVTATVVASMIAYQVLAN